MPNTKIHCAWSRKRNDGEDFKELHEWMDKPKEVLGIDHRDVRHSLSDIPKVVELFEKKYGKREAVYEFLMHIMADYKSTARKWKPRK